MYTLGQSTVTKRLESWKLVVPLHDNNNVNFDTNLVESITQGIVANFPGMTAINCVGHWREGVQTYKDRNLELIIDVAAADSSKVEGFFAKYKADLAVHLNQSKIYLTREQSKSEVMSFDEFFKEIALEVPTEMDDAAKRRAVEKTIGNVDFLMQRMSYETTMLRRDLDRKIITWERRICGFELRSEIADDLPPETVLIAADRIDHYAKWIKAPTSNVFVIGDWEFQKFVLASRPFNALVSVNLPKGVQFKMPKYLSQTGEPITHQRFAEEITMAILCGIMVFRDEGFHPNEIKATVGRDGATVYTVDPLRSLLFMTPAPIPDYSIQKEILRCAELAVEGLEEGTLSPLAVQQAKALHRYVFKRGAVRSLLESKPR